MRLRFFSSAFSALSLLVAASSARSATLTVTNTNDSGAGSLRQAITDANNENAYPGADTIQFADSVRGTIALTGGQLRISGPLTLTGPGAQQLALSGEGSTRHFAVAGGASVSISGLTLRNGAAPDAGGAASADARSGGSILNQGTLTLSECVLDGNKAIGLDLPSSAPYGTFGNAGRGGAILSDGPLTLRRCTLSNNLAQGGDNGGVGLGGAILSGSNAGPSLNLDNCTIAGNSARSSARGPLSSSDGYSMGGGIAAFYGTVALSFVTFTDNLTQSDGTNASVVGGGLYLSSAPTGNGTPLVTGVASNSLFAGNFARSASGAGVGADVYGTLAGNYNLVANPNGSILTGSNNKVNVADAKLESLAPNGGQTPTVALHEGSPAINAADPTVKSGTDQRGVTRYQVNRCDIGAFELEFTPAESLVVNTLFDENDGTSDPKYGVGTSLREAISFAARNETSNVILFDPAVFNGPKTLSLTLGGLSVSRPLTLTSPPAGTLTIERSSAQDTSFFTLLSISAGGNPVALQGLVLSGGKFTGIVNKGNLSMQDCRLVNSASSTTGSAGGLNNSGTAVLRNCTIANNTASFYGGGVLNSSGSTSLYNCTIAGNRASSGGGLFNFDGTLLLSNCTVTNNTATYSAGGIMNSAPSTGSLTLMNCTVAGNMAPYYASGVVSSSSSSFSPARTSVANTIIASNASTSNSGDVYGPFKSGGYNLIASANNATGLTGPGDQTGTSANPLNAGLEQSGGTPVLTDNGGPTQTIALLDTSPATNAGDPAFDAGTTPTDQRGAGFARVRGGRVDIGAFEVQNSAPGTLNVNISPAQPHTNDIVRAVIGVDGGDGSVTYSYQWKKNGVALNGETGATLDLSKAGNGDKGDQIAVAVVAHGAPNGPTERESAPVTVLNSTPYVDGVTITPTEPYTDSVLSAKLGAAADADGDPLTFSYTWIRNLGQIGGWSGTIAGETGPTLDLSKPGNGDQGDMITLSVSVSDGETSTSVGSYSVFVGGDSPVPTLDGVTLAPASPRTNDVLVALPSPVVDSQTYTYQWSKNGVVIEGETSSSLDLSKAGNGDRGDQIRVTVTTSNGVNTKSATSDVVTVANSAPSVADVSISPANPGTDSTLTASVGRLSDADGDTNLSLSYQWRKNGALIAGETGKTLDLSKAGNGELGDRISVTAIASDGSDSGTSDSPSVTVVRVGPVINSVGLSPKNPKTDDPITAVVNASANGAAIKSYTFVWTRTRSGKTTTIRTQTTSQNRDSLSTQGSIVVSSDLITVSVTANDGTYTSAPKSASIAVVNSPVAIGRLTLTPTSPKTNSVLVANAQFIDPDGGRSTNTYTWSKSSGGRTMTVFTETTNGSQSRLDLSQFGKGNKGDTITLTVTADDGQSKATKSQSVNVGNTVPLLSNLKLSPTAPTVTSKVTATFNAVDPDVDEGYDVFKYLYLWKAGGKSLSDEKGATVDLSKYKFLKAGDTLSLELRLGDGTTLSSTQKASVVLGAAPTAGKPSSGSS